MIRRTCLISRWRTRVTQFITCVTALLCLAPPVHAQPAVAQYDLSLEQLIKSPSLTLRGIDGRGGVEFGARADERIKNLTLDLAFTPSPALIESLSHLNVLLNGKYVSTIPLPDKPAAAPTQQQVALPAATLKPYNVLELQLIGHYTMGCEDPLHQDLWLRIEPSSKLIFDVERIALPDNLGMLPLPFFDARDFQPQPLTFVLGSPTDQRLEAAGIVASWFGALASYRGTAFRVSTQGIPKQGHAIVILAPNETLPGIKLPNVQGPMIAMRANPFDPASKLLIVTGRDDEEIRRAAVSLSLGGQVLSGAESLLTDIQTQPRQPYDAPNWVPTNRPVYLGELLPVADMTVNGYDAPAINIPLRLPPDLSAWKTASVPLQLQYRYTPLIKDENSKLMLFINQQYVEEFRLGQSNDGMWGALTNTENVASQTVDLPLSLLDSQAALQLKFTYPAPVRAECSGVYLNPRKSSLDPNSTIDFSGHPHHLAMPDLAAFRNAAFPFSRMADLSETVVLLPEQAQRYEYEAFLTVLGKVGQATGYPATALRVQRHTENLKNKDLLIIDGNTASSRYAQWAVHLPKPSSQTTATGWMAQIKDLFSSNPFKSTRPFDPPSNGIYAAGFESPISAGRSVVLIASTNAANLPAGVQDLLFNDAQAQHVQGGLVTVRAGSIESLSDEKNYYIGNLGAYQHTLWFLSKHPLLLLLIFLIGAVVIAIVLYLSLRARARNRLLIATRDSSPNHKE